MKWLLVIALAACGTKHEPVVHQIEIRGMQYVPAALVVHVGDTVVWTNRDVLPHTVTSAEFDSQAMQAKAEWSYRITRTGELPYRCTFHPTMFGKLIAE